MRRLSFVVLALALSACGSGGGSDFPKVIQLPRGFQPEGIEIGRGTTFYVGSLWDRSIYRGDLKTGKGATLVRGTLGESATGIELDRFNRLFVAGANAGKAYVYDAGTGALLRTYKLAAGTAFINDVVVTRHAAYFTDSSEVAVLYKIPFRGRALGAAESIRLTGDFKPKSGFNLNGIDATEDGETLVAVQSNTGKLFTIDPSAGVTHTISLGGKSLLDGDGLLLDGTTLYVVQNQNRIAVVALEPSLRSGKVDTVLRDRAFATPTTIDDLDRRLYIVNAHFGIRNSSRAAFQVLQLEKPKGH